MIPHAYLAGALAVVAAIAGAGMAGYRQGAKVERAECAERELAAREAADAAAESQRIAGRAADAQFARWRRESEARRAQTTTTLRNALQEPVTCPAGPLAAVPIPRSVLDSLRRAGADRAPDPGPAASVPR